MLLLAPMGPMLTDRVTLIGQSSPRFGLILVTHTMEHRVGMSEVQYTDRPINRPAESDAPLQEYR